MSQNSKSDLSQPSVLKWFGKRDRPARQSASESAEAPKKRKFTKASPRARPGVQPSVYLRVDRILPADRVNPACAKTTLVGTGAPESKSESSHPALSRVTITASYRILNIQFLVAENWKKQNPATFPFETVASKFATNKK